MSIELVLTESFQDVEAAVQAALSECGFKVRPSPQSAGVEIKSKMSQWLGERGNKVLSMVLPFVFKTEMVGATVTAYQDGTTALQVRANGVFGGNLATGATYNAASHVPGIGGAAAFVGARALSGKTGEADDARKTAAINKSMAQVEEKLRARLGSKIVYEGPVRPDAVPVMV